MTPTETPPGAAVPLSEQTQQQLRLRRDEFVDTENEARREFHETVAAARRRYLDSIVEALDEGTQVEVAEALGVTRGRVWQLIQEAKADPGASRE